MGFCPNGDTVFFCIVAQVPDKGDNRVDVFLGRNGQLRLMTADKNADGTGTDRRCELDTALCLCHFRAKVTKSCDVDARCEIGDRDTGIGKQRTDVIGAFKTRSADGLCRVETDFHAGHIVVFCISHDFCNRCVDAGQRAETAFDFHGSHPFVSISTFSVYILIRFSPACSFSAASP